MTVQIGCDPEFFMVDSKSGTVQSAVGIVGGTKQKPLPIKDFPKGYMVHEDNVLVELGIPPTTNSRTFATRISDAMAGINNMLPEGKVLSTSLTSHTFTRKQLNNKQAREIGCETDNDAYDGGNSRSSLPDLGLIRHAGGHVHISGDFNCPKFIAALLCDVYLTIPMMQHYGTHDRDTQRKQWYGKPGIFREKSYGIEYRTPSNSWVSSTNSLQFVGIQALWLGKTLEEESADMLRKKVNLIPWASVQDVIMTPTENKVSDLYYRLCEFIRLFP